MPVQPPPLSVTAPARPTPPAPLVGTPLGTFNFVDEDWTTIELWSGQALPNPLAADGQPFNLIITAAAAAGNALASFLTVPRSTRVCLYGQTFSLEVFNLVTQPNVVSARAFHAGQQKTKNVVEFGVALDPAGTIIQVPPYAKNWRFDVPESQKATAYMEILGPTGLTVGRYYWAEQPSSGVPVGGLGTLRLVGNLGNARVNFLLGV